MITDQEETEEILTEPVFSFFENCTNPKPIGEITFSQFMEDIRTGKYKEAIEEIRSIADKEKRDEVKKVLPAATITGTFGPKRGNRNLIKHSGLIQVDFDNVDDLMNFIERLKQNEYTYALFISPSGNGIKLFIRIPKDATRHKSIFRAIRKYYKKYFNLEADIKCGDISRICYVSYDPGAYDNIGALEFTDDPSALPMELKDFDGKAEDYPAELLYIAHKDDYGNLKYITIRHARFLQFLQVLGFKRFDIGIGFTLVRVKNNIVEEVSKLIIQDAFFAFIKSLPEELPDGVSSELLYEKFVKTPENYFSDMKLSIIERIEPNFCQDSAEVVRFFYSNGFVKCTKEGYSLHPYSEIDGLVWKNQILTRDFEVAVTDYTEASKLPDFAKFIWNVSGKDPDRFRAFFTLIGYLLHDFFEGKARAIILTDSDITSFLNGRTGKTLFSEALSKVSPLRVINGKDFDSEDRFKYQEVEYPDRIIHLNDIKKNLNIEKFFVDITEGVNVQKKNKQPFRKRVKIIISTNRTMKIEGASARDRVIEIEFSNHYGEQLSPQIEFGKWFFGEGWTNKDWIDFDNFVCACVCLYLREGVHKPAQINLGRRKLLAASNEDFLDFIDQRVKDGRISANILICKNQLRDDFVKEYPEYREKLKEVTLVTTWLRSYANFSGHFAPNNPIQDEKVSNGKRYLVFRSLGYKRTSATKFVPPTEDLSGDLIWE